MSTPTVLITGANRGLGLEFARRFAHLEWRVIACCRNPSQANELNEIAKQHAQCKVHALDVTDYAQMAQLSRTLSDRKIDLLLSNAGIYGPRHGFGDIEPTDWRRVFETNTIAPTMLAQHFVKQVAASDKRLIALISSKMGSIADNTSGGAYLYRSSKTALNQVGKSLSIDLAAYGINVVTLHPGWVKTDMGGPNALTSIADSVTGMMCTLDNASSSSGTFIDLDGSVIPW